jgi:hypothetical protein
VEQPGRFRRLRVWRRSVQRAGRRIMADARKEDGSHVRVLSGPASRAAGVIADRESSESARHRLAQVPCRIPRRTKPGHSTALHRHFTGAYIFVVDGSVTNIATGCSYGAGDLCYPAADCTGAVFRRDHPQARFVRSKRGIERIYGTALAHGQTPEQAAATARRAPATVNVARTSAAAVPTVATESLRA